MLLGALGRSSVFTLLCVIGRSSVFILLGVLSRNRLLAYYLVFSGGIVF